MKTVHLNQLNVDTLKFAISPIDESFEDIKLWVFSEFEGATIDIVDSIPLNIKAYFRGSNATQHITQKLSFSISKKTYCNIVKYKNSSRVFIILVGLYQYQDSTTINSFPEAQRVIEAFINEYQYLEFTQVDICEDNASKFSTVRAKLSLKKISDLPKRKCNLYKTNGVVTGIYLQDKGSTMQKQYLIYDKTFKNDLDITVTRFELKYTKCFCVDNILDLESNILRIKEEFKDFLYKIKNL